MPKWALITGAASGIGRCVARECASRGMNLVLVDINGDGLTKTADEIRETYQIEIHTFVQNLAVDGAAEKCLEFCDQNHVEIDFLANIAGMLIFDPLLDTEPKRINLILDLHVKTLTHMSVVFGQRMRERRFGYIFNMSSMSAYMPMPGIVLYNATKSYVRNLSRAMRFELLPWGVSVTAVCPGGVNTPLLPISDKLRKLGVALCCLMQPEKLAKKAVSATLKRKNQTIPGVLNHFFTWMIMALPDWLVMFIMKHLSVYDRYWKPSEQIEGDKRK